MDWTGQTAVALAWLGGLSREPWVCGTLAGLSVLLLALTVALARRVTRLRHELALSGDPSRTLIHAILATREARAGMATPRTSAGPARGNDGGQPATTAAGQAAAAAGQAAPEPPPAAGPGQRKRRRRGGGRSPGAQPGHAGPAMPAPDAAACHIKIYIDYANLVLNWRQLDPQLGIDWDQLPPVILGALEDMPVCAGRRIVYCGTHVYGSYFGTSYYDLLDEIENGTARAITMPFQGYKRQRLREALDKTIAAAMAGRDAMLEQAVKARLVGELADWRAENEAERELLGRTLRNKFGYVIFPFERRTPRNLRTAHYTSDGVPIAHEKGLDVRCCTDLMADAAFGMFDVAVVVSNDSDFVPAITFVDEELKLPVIQLGPATISDVVRRACSGHIDLEDVVARVRANRAPSRRPGQPPQPAAAPAQPRVQTAPAAPPDAQITGSPRAAPGGS